MFIYLFLKPETLNPDNPIAKVLTFSEWKELVILCYSSSGKQKLIKLDGGWEGESNACMMIMMMSIFQGGEGGGGWCWVSPKLSSHHMACRCQGFYIERCSLAGVERFMEPNYVWPVPSMHMHRGVGVGFNLERQYISIRFSNLPLTIKNKIKGLPKLSKPTTLCVSDFGYPISTSRIWINLY